MFCVLNFHLPFILFSVEIILKTFFIKNEWKRFKSHASYSTFLGEHLCVKFGSFNRLSLGGSVSLNFDHFYVTFFVGERLCLRFGHFYLTFMWGSVCVWDLATFTWLLHESVYMWNLALLIRPLSGCFI